MDAWKKVSSMEGFHNITMQRSSQRTEKKRKIRKKRLQTETEVWGVRTKIALLIQRSSTHFKSLTLKSYKSRYWMSTSDKDINQKSISASKPRCCWLTLISLAYNDIDIWCRCKIDIHFLTKLDVDIRFMCILHIQTRLKALHSTNSTRWAFINFFKVKILHWSTFLFKNLN